MPHMRTRNRTEKIHLDRVSSRNEHQIQQIGTQNTQKRHHNPNNREIQRTCNSSTSKHDRNKTLGFQISKPQTRQREKKTTENWEGAESHSRFPYASPF